MSKRVYNVIMENFAQANAGREKRTRIALLLMSDACLIFLSFVAAAWLQAVISKIDYQFLFVLSGVPQFALWQIGAFMLVYLVAFASLQLFSSIWSVSGLDEGVRIIVAVGAGLIGCILLNFLFGNTGKTILCISGVLLLPLLFCSRFGYRIIRRVISNVANGMNKGKTPVLVVGAGFFGAYVKSQIEQSGENRGSYVAMFVDDDPAKANMRVGGVKVRGTIADVPRLVQQHDISEILIAIPSLSDRRMAQVAEICSSTKCRVRTVPRLSELGTGNIPTMRDIREMSFADVLFRPEVVLDEKGISDYISHKSVLVTGGGGSIGSEIARQIARFAPATLVLFDNYENTTYELYCELKHKFPRLNIVVQIGSVQDVPRLTKLMADWPPDLVIHTAAHKHVPLMEDNPAEAVKNNVLGTRNVLRAADESGVKRFVQLSTDKAVNPTNVMGASKRVTELLVRDFAASTQMKCMTVRFGNVLGSQGSVIPLFERQIKAGGPVLITHPDITRYFMTIPEAAQLVLQAGAMGESGAIYVLDMGQPVRIMDLAEKIIRFYGYQPHADMPIEIIGLRPGEKMFEELLLDEEAEKMQITAHGRIFRAHFADLDGERFRGKLETLIAAAAGQGDVRQALLALVPNYHTGSALREENDAPQENLFRS